MSWLLQIDIEDVEESKPSKRGKRAISHPTSVSSGSALLRRDKINKNNFTPRTYRLANTGKSSARERIAMMEGFPKDKDVFIWEAIQHGVKNNDILQEILQVIQGDVDRKDTLVEYAWVIFACSNWSMKTMMLTCLFSRLVMQSQEYVVTLSWRLRMQSVDIMDFLGKCLGLRLKQLFADFWKDLDSWGVSWILRSAYLLSMFVCL